MSWLAKKLMAKQFVPGVETGLSGWIFSPLVYPLTGGNPLPVAIPLFHITDATIVATKTLNIRSGAVLTVVAQYDWEVVLYEAWIQIYIGGVLRLNRQFTVNYLVQETFNYTTVVSDAGEKEVKIIVYSGDYDGYTSMVQIDAVSIPIWI